MYLISDLDWLNNKSFQNKDALFLHKQFLEARERPSTQEVRYNFCTINLSTVSSYSDMLYISLAVLNTDTLLFSTDRLDSCSDVEKDESLPAKKKKRKTEKKKKRKKNKKKSGRHSSGSDSDTVYPSDFKEKEAAEK